MRIAALGALAAWAAGAQSPTTFTFDFGSGMGTPGYAAKPPFYFSVAVPEEGNYRVTVMLGDRDAESVTTVKAELRRLMYGGRGARAPCRPFRAVAPSRAALE